MRLQIRHETTHRYDAPPGWLTQLIRLTPIDTPEQRVISWRVYDERADVPLACADGYGNACHLFTLRDVQRVSRVVAEGEVETLPTLGAGAAEPLPARYFLRSTPLTAPAQELAALGEDARLQGGAGASELLALAELVRERVGHCSTSTNVTTSARDALAGGSGVCQDRTHVFLAAARALGHPARYVSGYWHGAAVIGDAGAMHAWAEVWLPETGWIALDPSSGERVSLSHVRVAIGLDYTEAAPIRGVRKGGAEEHLDVRVQIQATQHQQ